MSWLWRQNLTLFLLVLAATVIHGCSRNVEHESLRIIKIGTPRAEVEEVLGEPLVAQETSVGLIHTYTYSYDANEFGTIRGCAVLCLVILPPALIVDVTGVFDENRQLHIVYGPDGRVVELVKYIPEDGSAEAVILQRREWRQIAALKRNRLTTEAQEGNPDAQYKLSGKTSNITDKWKWLCRAGMQGHGPAQFEIGKLRETGGGPVDQDLVLAYVWYSLADRSGFQEPGTTYLKTSSGWKCCFATVPRREVIAKGMSEEEVSKGQRLLAEWEPNPAECEAELQTAH